MSDEMIDSKTGEKQYVPPPIGGYNVLSQSQIDLINKIKAHEAETLRLHAEVKAHVTAKHSELTDVDSLEFRAFTEAEPYRWLAISKTHLQEGFMALVRSVTRPKPL